MIPFRRLIPALGLGIVALVAAGQVHAELNLFACEPEWGALASEIGGDKVSVFTATTAHQDPHQVQARPALIARLRAIVPGNLAFCEADQPHDCGEGGSVAGCRFRTRRDCASTLRAGL
jgi:ABC-type Zn uptake system ZnuABC Zn-binding protein ZnuA